VKYAWIDGPRKAYPLPAMCETLTVSISGYRAWKRGGSPNCKRLTDTRMLALIHTIHISLNLHKSNSTQYGRQLRLLP
jgi:putative transposase